MPTRGSKPNAEVCNSAAEATENPYAMQPESTSAQAVTAS
jgi:hypothetical protein